MAAYGATCAPASDFAFAERVFGYLPRTDQRRWAVAYLRSLQSTPGKKTLRRLAATISDSPTASQSLHQLVNASPWDWAPVREELTRWTEQRVAPKAWTIDVAVLRKRGYHSCGVHRRFVPATGRSVTCQLGVGAFLTTDSTAVPVDWRLLLPTAWAKDPQRRTRARIPEDVGAQIVAEHALDLVDTLAASSRNTALPVVADLSEHTGIDALALGLSARHRDFVIAVPPGLRVLPADHLSGGQPTGPLDALRFFESADNSPRIRLESVLPSEGSRHVPVLTGLVRLVQSGPTHLASRRTFRLFAVRTPSGRHRLWLSNMLRRRTDELLALTRLPALTARTVDTLQSDFGLGDFEGRSFPGWHHHMTLVSAAYAHSQLNAPAVPRFASMARAG